jgi:hypothetical protein
MKTNFFKILCKLKDCKFHTDFGYPTKVDNAVANTNNIAGNKKFSLRNSYVFMGLQRN